MAARDVEVMSVQPTESNDTLSDTTSASDVQEGKPSAGHNSAWTTAGILVADVVGAGVLGMPVAFGLFGWLLGSVLLTVMLMANVHISLKMWQVQVSFPGVHTYGDLARVAFAGAAAWQQKGMEWFTASVQLLLSFCVMGLYFLTAGKALGMVFYEVHLCLPQWTLLAVFLVLPFQATSRQMGSNKFLIYLNIVTLVLAVALPLGHMAVVGADELRPEGSKVVAVADVTIQKLLSGLCSFTFALTGQVILPEIIAEMKDPQELPRAYGRISAPFQWTALFVTGVGGYLVIGDKVTGTIDDNVPFGVVFRLAAFCLMTHMLVSVLIKGVIVCSMVHRTIDREHSSPDDKSFRAVLGWNIVVVCVAMLAWLLANLVPFFTDAVNLMGATLIPISCWLIPIMIFARWYYDAGEHRPRIWKAEWLVLLAELALVLALMTFATYYAVETLMDNWKKHGKPFECHCGGMWNTCACSSDHIGMEAMCSMPGHL